MVLQAPTKEQILKDFLNEPRHTCFHCGRVSRAMVTDSQGRYYCINRVDCWHRWDEQHGLRGFSLE